MPSAKLVPSMYVDEVWQPAMNKKAASAKSFVICMLAQSLSRRAGQASLRCVSSHRPIPYRQLECQKRTSGRPWWKLQYLHTSLLSPLSNNHWPLPGFALRPYLPMNVDSEQTFSLSALSNYLSSVLPLYLVLSILKKWMARKWA